MVFSSPVFLFSFLPVLLLFYFLSPQKYKNAVALLGSLFFYIWGATEFFLILLPLLLADFYLVQLTSLAEGKLRKRLFVTSLSSALLLLFVAKYFNFFIDNLNLIPALWGGEGLEVKKIILPIGISFITFQRISYLADCYRGRTKPLTQFRDYLLYILLFPQLIAGPIVRFNEIASQIQGRFQGESADRKMHGLFRFTLGLSKKVLIADVLGETADGIFNSAPEFLNAATAWLGIVVYSMQIYFDFSGYSDMAVGLGLLLGFRFPENFNFPYISRTITEFWRRWHITLGTWMRDYLYIPLGGNRVSQRRLYFNLWVVFFLSGLWHGAAWTFVFWGAFHGLFLIADRLFLAEVSKRIGKIPSVILTYFIVLLAWVFFRADNLSSAFSYLGAMFSFDFSIIYFYLDNRFLCTLTLALFFAFSGLLPFVEHKLNEFLQTENTNNISFCVKGLFVIIIGFLCVSEIFASGFNPFIYFRF